MKMYHTINVLSIRLLLIVFIVMIIMINVGTYNGVLLRYYQYFC